MESAQRTKRPVFVPASIQRLRCYLNTRAGMKVKPWAGVEDTLDAFYDALASQKKEGDFWQGLEALLNALTKDMDRRADARGRGVIPNELLDVGARAGLLDEIRRKLDGQRKGRGRFRRLASTLSAPALGLAVILGSAATVGCYGSSNRHDDADTSTDPAVEADAADTAPDLVPDPLPDPGLDPDVLPDPVVDPVVDPEMDPEADPEVDPVVDPACDSGLRTIEEILAGCPLGDEERLHYLECIDALHASWTTGLTELFACESCDEIIEQLRDCLSWRCTNPEGQGPFDLEDFLDNCAVIMYLGVRFE